MEQKINIAELLKDCPKGMELDCTMYDNATLIQVQEDNIYPIKIETPDGSTVLTKYGGVSYNKLSKCIIFPKGKTTWEGFVPPCKFNDGDAVAVTMIPEGIWTGIFKQYEETSFESHCCLNTIGEFHSKGLKNHSLKGLRFATEEEKQKLFQAIKDNGYKWNEETKTLEKLTPKKFDISTLKAFDKVLVRDNNEQKWTADLFSFYDKSLVYPYSCVGHYTNQCVPFESNKHLLGTTDDCDEHFKNWE